MVNKKLKGIMFDDGMEQDLEEIKKQFTEKFRITPSNPEIINLLLKTYKETNLRIQKKPRHKNKFEVFF